MPKVLRIENSKGIGPYAGEPSDITNYRWTTGRHGDDNHPTLIYDKFISGSTGLGNKRHYGFSSVEQLLAWFTPHELINLRSLGYQVKVFDIPSDCIGYYAHQCIFLKNGN